jgi:hypothetical protein
MGCNLKPKKVNIANELQQKQRNNVPKEWKLSYKQMERISKYLPESIFDQSKCIEWEGYVDNTHSIAPFYFNSKNEKTSIHRVLYLNFIGDLQEDEKVKHNCKFKKRCCNLNHMYKHKTKCRNQGCKCENCVEYRKKINELKKKYYQTAKGKQALKLTRNRCNNKKVQPTIIQSNVVLEID